MKLNNLFLEHCKLKKFEINNNQLEIINNLESFYKENSSSKIFGKLFNNNKKIGFYLFGDVGVGKTMLLNFFFSQIKEKKLRLHFNEFMIGFHDFIFQMKDKENGIEKFVKDLSKKTKILYFDEFQVTNIVDAMILGKLFQKIFEEKILVLFSSNIKINDLYKDGLQREQFLPFIKILQNYCYERELLIAEDYRTSTNNGSERFLAPINEKTNFIFNKFFRTLTKNIKKENKILEIKGRNLIIENFFNGIAKFNFDELCNRNIGSEDYIEIANNCSFIFIENLPDFNHTNSNQQQRFITLIDILYEKKIPLMITSEKSLDTISSSADISNVFKRTISRLHELTSLSFQSK
ncbi:MAG: cell division protein ZapE [Pelagibacteraceae bacterium]|jgi:cell division protein ZapE